MVDVPLIFELKTCFSDRYFDWRIILRLATLCRPGEEEGNLSLFLLSVSLSTNSLDNPVSSLSLQVEG
jgi:hypothetical protein